MSAKPFRKKAQRKKNEIPLPPATDWRTTDRDETLRRVQRAREEKHRISNLDPAHPIFSNFRVSSPSGMIYQTEIRDLVARAFSCTCPDFRTNGLDTCKHVEATLLWLKRRHAGEFRLAEKEGSKRADLVPMKDALGIERNPKTLSPSLRRLFDGAGILEGNSAPALEKLRRNPAVRIGQDGSHSWKPAGGPGSACYCAATTKVAWSRGAILSR
jgi:hypothetical protein